MSNPTCVYPECQNTPRGCGLCYPHYEKMRSYVRSGKATEKDLRKRGLLLHKNAPDASSPIFDSDAFLSGSTVIGDAPKTRRIKMATR